MVKIKYANNPDKSEYELQELNKGQVVHLNLHGIKNDSIRNYTEIEMISTLIIGENLRNIHFRFGNINDYEAYINSIDQGYDSEDAIFNGYIHIIDTPEFNLVNRSQYGIGCDFKHEIVEYQGDNCFIPA